MSVLDTDFLSEIQQTVVENTVDGGVTWQSGLWTATEVLQYAIQRQNRFMKESGLLYAQIEQNTTANTAQNTLPTDWMTTVRVAWKPIGGTYKEVPRGSLWEADLAFPTWPTVSRTDHPQQFADFEGPDTLNLWLLPPANVNGVISLLYLSLADDLTGIGEIFTVPDEFVPYIKWGVLADMFNKAGRAHDPARAEYAQQRFQDGVETAKILLQSYEIQ
jgi:hypothetical protein